MAALTRQMDAGDAAGAAWLRADPSYVRPDINGARLLAIGPSLGMDEEDRTAFLPALRPLFGAAGFPLDTPTTSRAEVRSLGTERVGNSRGRGAPYNSKKK